MAERRRSCRAEWRRREIESKINTTVSEIDELTKWKVIDSPLTIASGRFSFEDDFEMVIPRQEIELRHYIEKTLAPEKGNAIGMEVGGTASKLFSEFTPGFFKRTAGISRTDYRSIIDPILPAEDAARNHTVIPGNMLEEETKQRAEDWLGGKKVHVIFERVLAGEDWLPNEPFYMSQQANYWYQHLAEKGLMFAQMPSAFRWLGSAWVKHIQKQYQERLEIQAYRRGFIRLQKLEGAPEELPLLDARTAIREQRRAGF